MDLFSRSLFDLRFREFHLVRLLFALYACGFLYGTRNHIVDILHDGFLGYTYVPLPINIYWTALTFLDPAAVVLLILFPFAGMVLSVVIMATDIIINTSVTLYDYSRLGILSLDRLPLQIAFALFLFLTTPIAWRRIRTGTARFSMREKCFRGS